MIQPIVATLMMMIIIIPKKETTTKTTTSFFDDNKWCAVMPVAAYNVKNGTCKDDKSANMAAIKDTLDLADL
jgi:hypothetical protein